MKLADFKGGIVVGVEWPQLFKCPKTSAKVQKWITEGKLVSSGPNPHPIMDVLWPAEERIKPVLVEPPIEKPVAKPVKEVSELPSRPKVNKPPLALVPDRVLSLVRAGANVRLWDQGKLRSVNVSRWEEPTATLWWDLPNGVTVSIGCDWNVLERAIAEDKPIRGGW